ncbi:hypothetical protein D917_03808 [Trichinella nativa]|uniref:Uncharacterized protein n=1 Tax=Trichinella nativa TaxID=6335 RepID=A0A1Y3EAB0_9BILA|nr:hypothetical protein D917_03808 [Trichinella nativa]
MTAGSCHGGLADQAQKVRTLDVLRDQKPAHNEMSSTLLSLFQSSLLLGQSRTPLLLSIFSSFLLQDLLLYPSYPQVSKDGDGLNEIMISEAKAHTTEDSCQLCQRIDDSFLVLVKSM